MLDLSPRASAEQNHNAFILRHCRLLAVPLVPEISLYLAHEALPLWRKTEEELEALGVPPPFWAFAWAGGQALARYILDNPDHVRGRRVIDIATGSGLVAIAAMLAGARHVLAADIDPFSASAVELNAKANNVDIDTTTENLLDNPLSNCDIVVAGDIFYEQTLAQQAFGRFEQAQANGIDALIGDPKRSYFPTQHLHQVMEYEVPVTRELEDSEIKRTAVWRLQA